jgi:hypothetical protein
MSLRNTGMNLIEPTTGPKGRLTHPNVKYLKSKEGIAEFKKAGLQYPDSYLDEHYEKFLERTPAGPGNNFSHKNKTRITSVTRIRLAPGKEFLIWNQTETRYSPLGNHEQDTRLNLGRYPVIEYRNVTQEDEDTGYRHTVTEPTGYTKTGYSLEYNLNLESIDNLHKNANDDYEFEELTEKEIKPTHYYLQDLRKKTTVVIRKWEDFRDGDFNELWEYGKKVSSEEEAKAIKAKIEKDRQRVEEQKLDMLKRGL